MTKSKKRLKKFVVKPKKLKKLKKMKKKLPLVLPFKKLKKPTFAALEASDLVVWIAPLFGASGISFAGPGTALVTGLAGPPAFNAVNTALG